jgi:SAM-dependent methyltransferase
MHSKDTAVSVNYQRVYDRLYRFGYHRKTTKSHAKTLSRVCIEQWQPKSVLDVGCSIGWTLDYFGSQGVKATGVDISEVAVSRARKLGRDAHVSCASALPFPDKHFDVVISTDCLEHLTPADAPKAVREMCRVARVGIAVKVNPRLDRDPLWKLIAGGSLHLTLQPVEQWLEWFRASGWDVVQSDDSREEYLLEPAANRPLG